MAIHSHLPTSRPLRIFVVEDFPDTLTALTTYLEYCGHTVFSARTMEGAITGLSQARCDVLMADLGLPDGDGWELMRRLGDERPAYAIAMSGFGRGAEHVTSEAAGFRRHLLKPFSLDELDTALSEAAREAA